MTSPNGHTSARGGQTTSRTVVGLFKERARAEDAICELRKAGFAGEQIGVATRDRKERPERPAGSGRQGTEPAANEEEDARYFDAGFREGGTLVTVNAGERTPDALATLQRYGADLGPARTRYQGSERRCRQEVSYSGPERRLVGV